VNFRHLKRYVCHKYRSCKNLVDSCTSHTDEKIPCIISSSFKENNIDRFSLFKIGDEVEITNKYNNVCSAEHTAPYMSNRGTVTLIDYDDLPIKVNHYYTGKDDDKYHFTIEWYHIPECLKLINQGFDPNELISKAFGGVN